MSSLGNGAERSSQGKAETRLGCRAQPDQGDEHGPNGAAGDMAGVGTSLTLHAVEWSLMRHATSLAICTRHESFVPVMLCHAI